MSTETETSLRRGFSTPGVHSLVYKDDFVTFAADMRDELLRYPSWKEMTQDGLRGAQMSVPHRQNGITTGHLLRATDRERLPHSTRFGEFLFQNLAGLCPLVGVNAGDAHVVEMNAMAYGAGAWLSPHTDSFEYGLAEDRLAAWMLYLTAPEDGEWSREKGGAVRVWTPDGNEQRVSPRFNRFVMFRVYDRSFHEIEKVTWQPDWPHCRLALSGWIRGRPAREVERKTRVYVQSPAAQERWAEGEATLQGSLALHRLLAQQKAFCGLDAGQTLGRIAILEEDYRAHSDAPPGTAFLHRLPGPAGCVIVVNEAGDVVHFGTLQGYLQKLASQPPAD